ncbi:MAG: methionyl-tRNA formyltransferase [Planctomycetota bacterium]|nr:methionyl-tRNA formyltransferase [Planctomycetota bacterium]
MRVVFLGSGEFGLPTARAIAREHQLLAIVSQPDKPAGRGGQLTPTPISAWAASEHPGVPCIKPADVNAPEIVAQVRAFKPDAFVVIAFGQKLGGPLLADIPAINLHASRLPRWRGAAPINWAILAGDSHTGNSVITLAQRMDAGLILAQSERRIDPVLTTGELHDLLSADGPELVLRVLAELARDPVAALSRGAAQDPALVTHARKLSKDDAWIDLNASAEDCRRRVHGLNPWPGVSVTFRGEPLKVLRVGVHDSPAGGAPPGDGASNRVGDRDPNAVVARSNGAEPGVIFDADLGLVACARGVLQLRDVQAPGKRAMAWGDFSRGLRVRSGEILTGAPPRVTPPTAPPRENPA